MNKKYIKSSAAVVIILFAGKIVGFLKQLIVGWIFGANQGTDIYFMAEGFVAAIINAIFAAFAVTMLRTYVAKKKISGNEGRNQFISNVLFMQCIFAVLIFVLFIMLSPFLSRILAPSYDESKTTVLSRYMVLLAPTLLIASITSVLGAVLDGEELFTYSKLSGIITSVTYIIICLLIGRKLGVSALIAASILGYVIYFLFLVSVIHNRTDVNIKKPYWDREISSIILLALPVMLGNAVADLNAIVDKSIASDLISGSVSALYYGQIASNDIINGVFIYAVGSILITYFTGLALENDKKPVIDKARQVMKLFVTIIVPISIIYIIVSNEISAVLFGHGAIESSGAGLIAQCMRGYAFGFPFLAIREVLINVHYAYNDMKRPMINGCIAVGINIVLSILLSKCWGVFGITFASSIAVIIATILSEYTVTKHVDKIIFLKIRDLMKIIVSAVITLSVVLWIRSLFSFNGLADLIVCVVASFLIYFGSLAVMRDDTVLNVLRGLTHNDSH